MFSACCTIDEPNAGKIATDHNELAAKGEDLRIAEERKLPDAIQNQADVIGYLPEVDWNLDNKVYQILKTHGPQWRKVVLKDKDILKLSENPIQFLSLEGQGMFLGQVDSKKKKIMEGVCHYKDSEGNYFLSCYERNLPHKYGLFASKTGEYFLGEYMDGNRVYGKSYYPDQKKTYDGSYEDNLPHGVGVLKFDDGREYRGQFFGGKPDGKGVYNWPNGNKYEGEFKDGKQHGMGYLYVAKNQKTFLTYWEDGVMHD